MSPFWSDNDIRLAGTVRYVGIERGASSGGDAIFTELSSFINRNIIAGGDAPFEPTWLLVAQWDGIHPYPHGADDHEGVDEEYLRRVRLL